MTTTTTLRTTRYPDLPVLPARVGRHVGGLCGGPAQACGTYIAADAAALTAWAATAPPPQSGETPMLYWDRVTEAVRAAHPEAGLSLGLWIDAWYGVAFDLVEHAKETNR